MEIFWISLSEKLGGESQNFVGEWFMSCSGCCHMVAQHWRESWNTHHPFPSPPGRNPRHKIQHFRMAKSNFQTLVFAVSSRRASLWCLSTRWIERYPSFLGWWLMGWGSRWSWDYRLLFSNMELWYVLGILKKVSWEAGLGVLWSFRSHFTPEFPKRWEKFSFLR